MGKGKITPPLRFFYVYRKRWHFGVWGFLTFSEILLGIYQWIFSTPGVLGPEIIVICEDHLSPFWEMLYFGQHLELKNILYIYQYSLEYDLSAMEQVTDKFSKIFWTNYNSWIINEVMTKPMRSAPYDVISVNIFMFPEGLRVNQHSCKVSLL